MRILIDIPTLRSAVLGLTKGKKLRPDHWHSLNIHVATGAGGLILSLAGEEGMAHVSALIQQEGDTYLDAELAKAFLAAYKEEGIFIIELAAVDPHGYAFTHKTRFGTPDGLRTYHIAGKKYK